MVNMVQKKVENHLSGKELKNKIKHYKNDCRMYQRFVFIDMVRVGKKVSEACDILKISEPTGHRWLDLYNENGPEGLNLNYQNCGTHSKMSDEQLDEFSRIIENEEYLTAQRAHEIIKRRYNIDYSIQNVKNILDKLEYNKGKPYQKFSQKPENAEMMLKKTYEE